MAVGTLGHETGEKSSGPNWARRAGGGKIAQDRQGMGGVRGDCAKKPP